MTMARHAKLPLEGNQNQMKSEEKVTQMYFRGGRRGQRDDMLGLATEAVCGGSTCWWGSAASWGGQQRRASSQRLSRDVTELS
jgi:hypothetical protein